MLKKVIKFIDENHMIEDREKVLVALSGGPDSICLLHMLWSLRDKLNIELCAAHLNHCLRGDESDKDEDYAKNFCEILDIPFYSKKVDIIKYSKDLGLSSEMSGRKARYDFFNELKDKYCLDKIAIAHNANDQAETVLMRLMRGTGIEGLIGIRPVRDSIYIRPILSLTRQEIESYCEENKLKPRIDKTNLETIYSRNKVRLELIPYIKENFNEDIVSTLNRFSKTMSIDNDYLEEVCEKKYKKFCRKHTNKIEISKDLFYEHESILSRVLRKAIFDFNGSLYNIEKVHIHDIICLSNQGTGKKINLPNNLIAENVYDNIVIKFKTLVENFSAIEFQIDEEKLKDCIVLENSFKGYTIALRITNNSEILDFKNNNFIKYFDLKDSNSVVTIRGRMNGDKFTPYGMKGNKKLKDLFIDLKIPKDDRDNIPLVAINDEIAWIVGYRVSDKFKISRKSRKILEVKFYRKEENNA